MLTGGEEGEVLPVSFQVSNQCTGMVRDELVRPSQYRNMLAVNETTKTVFVPEVSYSQAGASSTSTKADPDFPADYFFVEVGSGTSAVPQSYFPTADFPVENRLNKAQSPDLIYAQLTSSKGSFSSRLADFSLLFFLYKLLRDKPKMQQILEVLHVGDSSRPVSEKDLHTLLEPLLASFVPAKPTPLWNTASSHPSPSLQKNQPQYQYNTQQPNFAPPPSINQAKFNEMKKMLLDMGYTEKQAEEGLYYANFQSVEAAINYLVGHM